MKLCFRVDPQGLRSHSKVVRNDSKSLELSRATFGYGGLLFLLAGQSDVPALDIHRLCLLRFTEHMRVTFFL